LNTNISAYTNKRYVNKINYLQEVGYTIDLKLFLYVFKHLDISEYFYKKSNKIDILLDFDYISYYDNELLKNKRYYVDLVYRKKYDITKKKELERIIMNNDNLKKKTSNNTHLHLNDLLVLLFLYLYIEGNIIYHLYKVDSRGRLYHDGIITYISSKLLRFLLKIKNKKKYSNKKINNLFKYYFCKQLYGRKVTNIKDSVLKYDSYVANLDEIDLIKKIKNESIKILNKMNLIKVIKKGMFSNISIDATSSLLQIISVITKNKKLMYYTNVIKNKNSMDIYDFLIEKLKLEYSSSKFIKYYTNRKIVKYVCMTYIYGSTAKYLSTDMQKLYGLNILLEDLIKISSNILNLFNIEFKVIKKIKSLVNYYIKILPLEFEIKYKLLDKKLKYNCSRKKKINIEVHDETINKIHMTLNINSNIKDNSMKKKSALVNIIHSIDSQICINTRYTLLKKHKVKTLSIHDNFIINIQDYEIVLKSYNKELSNFLDTDLINIISDLKDIHIFIKSIVLHYFEKNNHYECLRIINTGIKFINKKYYDDYINSFLNRIQILKKEKNIKLTNTLFKEYYLLFKDLIEKIKEYGNSYNIINNYIIYEEKKLNTLIKNLKEEESFKLSDKKLIHSSKYSLQPE
jgi:hypothetical protein